MKHFNLLKSDKISIKLYQSGGYDREKYRIIRAHHSYPQYPAVPFFYFLLYFTFSFPTHRII